MIVLGINCFKHDAAAALVADGKIVAAAEEERFVRRKHTGEFPSHAARYCLREAGAGPGDVDVVAFYMRPSHFLGRLPTRGLGQFARSRDLPAFARTAAVIVKNYGRMVHIPRRMREENLAGPKTAFEYVEHHLAHAAAAYFTSGYDRAAILSLDGVGEWTTGLLAEGAGTRITKLVEHFLPSSLGHYYLAFTRYLGFPEHGDEYKVMGLSSYGQDAYHDLFARLLSPRPDGTFRLDHSYFDTYFDVAGILHTPKLEEALGPRRRADDDVTPRHCDIAASAQAALNDVGVSLASYLARRTRSRRLCLTGGVALNCVMNQRILNAGIFEEVYVPPAAHDAGASLGAALYAFYRRTADDANRAELKDAALGPAYPENVIEENLKTYKISYERPADIAAVAAEALAGGHIVGWFQGRAEFGPRALGQRSILADARRPDMKDLVNRTVKYREGFRPFAPSVKRERAGEYFTPDRDAPFMTFTFDATPRAREEIPAVVHVDGTSRIQTVDAATHPLYHRLLTAYERLTGAGAVLNTSFNVKGEPIVLSPEDALRCYFTSGLDALALGPFWLRKR